jgi:hypothetical protein
MRYLDTDTVEARSTECTCPDAQDGIEGGASSAVVSIYIPCATRAVSFLTATVARGVDTPCQEKIDLYYEKCDGQVPPRTPHIQCGGQRGLPIQPSDSVALLFQKQS